MTGRNNVYAGSLNRTQREIPTSSLPNPTHKCFDLISKIQPTRETQSSLNTFIHNHTWSVQTSIHLKIFGDYLESYLDFTEVDR